MIAKGTDGPLLLTERQAAQTLCISAKTLADLRKSGQIPFVRVGKTGVRYAVSDVRQFVAEKRILEGGDRIDPSQAH